MNKIQTHPYKVYSGPNKKTIAYDEENLSFIEVNLFHLFVLENFRSPKEISDILISLNPSKRKKVKQAFEELNEFGFFESLKPYKRPKIFNLKPKIRGFRIVLTEECNLRCKECFVTKYPRHKIFKTIPYRILNKLIKETISYGIREKITYHFFGGEPLIRFDYIKQAVRIINAAVKMGEIIKPNYAITTNLTLLNQEMIDFFKRNDFKIGVSIDGPKKINNKFRIYKNGRGSFDDIKRNYQRLVKAGIDVYILITPHADFLNQLPKIFQNIIQNFPMKTITVNTPFHYRNLAWSVDGKKYAKILTKLIRIAKKYKITMDSAASEILFALSRNLRRKCPCMFNNDYILVSINPEGRISFCAQNWDDVPTVTFRRGIKIPMSLSNKCKDCEARNICGGPCPAFQIISRRKIDKQKCKFMTAMLKEIAANIYLFQK